MDKNCQRCPLAATRTRVVDGTGPVNARIMLIGEAPGKNEDREGRPFVGAAGRTLNGHLAAAGLDRLMVRVTNAVRCRPPDNRTPSVVEQAACQPWLDEELALVQPKVVLVMGKTASRRAFPKESKVPHEKAIAIDEPWGTVVYIGSYHPAALWRDHSGRWTESFLRSLRMAKHISEEMSA